MDYNQFVKFFQIRNFSLKSKILEKSTNFLFREYLATYFGPFQNKVNNCLCIVLRNVLYFEKIFYRA